MSKEKNSIAHTGRCSCGEIRYQTKGEPERVTACHCKECQRRTGSAFGIGCYFHKENVEITHPNGKTYTRVEQGRRLDFKFCKNCGTTVAWTLDLFPNFIAIAAGTFENVDWITPQAHVWTQSAHHWMPLPNDVPILKQGSVQEK